MYYLLLIIKYFFCLKFTHERESYLIFHRYHKIEPNLLMLQLKDKEIL